jgi:hypothetical protein
LYVHQDEIERPLALLTVGDSIDGDLSVLGEYDFGTGSFKDPSQQSLVVRTVLRKQDSQSAQRGLLTDLFDRRSYSVVGQSLVRN